MKKLIPLCAILLLVGCKATDVTIIMTVDTQNLFPISSPTKNLKEANVVLSDDNKGHFSKSRDLEHFKSKVYDSMMVTWVGISKSPDYSVAIDSIKAKNKVVGHQKINKIVFNDSTIIGRGGPYSIVSDRLKNGARGVFVYTIHCTIYENSTGSTRNLDIVPKLRVK